MFGFRSATRLRRLGAATATLIVLGAAACENPQPPTACGAIPQVTVNTGETATASACFNDPNGDMLTFSAMSSNRSVATASISGASITVRAVAPGNASATVSVSRSRVTITAVAAGSATVTITARDPGGLTAESAFPVDVIGDSGFTIELVLATAMSSGQEAAFREAAERWMSILAETDLSDIPVNGTIDCGGEDEQNDIRRGRGRCRRFG